MKLLVFLKKTFPSFITTIFMLVYVIINVFLRYLEAMPALCLKVLCFFQEYIKCGVY